jgi:asparagine N-glycosylation enzyme membrane subunit Stt3
MRDREPRWLIGAVLVVLGVVAYFARTSYDVNRSRDPRNAEWVSLEPDSFYHMRRTERALLSGGDVAGVDPFLDYPDGAEIPWPPYYAQILTLIAGWTVDDVGTPEARLKIERLVASLPLWFGCLTVLLAGLAAWRLGGSTAGAFAGMASAAALGTVLYSSLGNA